MPRIHTRCFEEIEYTESSLFHFPNGLPGFAQEHDFVFLNRPESQPLMFMQSAGTPDLCFVLLPVFTVAPDYQLTLEEEALAELRLPLWQQPKIGVDILCAVIVCADGKQQPTVNLLAPIVVNLRERTGLQSIQTQAGYSHRHPLAPKEEMASC